MTFVRFVSRALSSCFFITFPIEAFARRRGWSFTGSGFVGSLAGLVCARYLPQGSLQTTFVLIGAVLLSVVISDIAEEDFGSKDDQRIVIDEWVGYLISVAYMPLTPGTLWAGFVLFRIFDSTKPLGIRRLGHLPGGWGVVLDDVAAGILAQCILQIFFLCRHQFPTV